MTKYGKTYILGSSEAMKYEPRLDEEYYSKSFSPNKASADYASKLNVCWLEEVYLEDHLDEQYDDIDCHPNYNPITDSTET